MLQDMTKPNFTVVEKYQHALLRDPDSKVFAPLADAYRELGMFEQAEKTIQKGLQRHSKYASAWVVLGRILLDQKNYFEALIALQTATELDTENLLAHHLTGQAHLQLHHPKEALKAFKMVLFLNPLSQKAKNAIDKLESLTADEYEDEAFEMKPLSSSSLNSKQDADELTATVILPSVGKAALPMAPLVGNSAKKDLERNISLIDALIVRNDLQKARELLLSTQNKFPEDPGLISRWELIHQSIHEDAVPIQPLLSRHQQILHKKIQTLEKLLHRIKD